MARRFVLYVAVLLLGVSPAAWAQTVAVAQLSGTVLDESGGALPGVEVTVTQTDTGMTRFVVAGSRGEFVFTSLPVGPYKLSAQLQGFSTFEQTGIVLAVGDARAINARLKVGTISETITVAANASVVDRKSTRLNSSHVKRSRMPSSA